jgi:undecaprenyl-diphosphatase
MDPVHVFLLALLQGVAELFPVSSLGHTILIPGLLGWNETLNSPTFLPLVVSLHLGTAIALLFFYWRDWIDLLRGGLRVVIAGKLTPDVDPQQHGRTLMLLITGAIPVGVIGVLFQKRLEENFSQPMIAATFLVVNGAVLITAEQLWQNQRSHAVALARKEGRPVGTVGNTIENMTFLQAALIGLSQIFALIPGFSRSGLTIAAGMASGMSHEAAARFSFLMATPIIFAAGVLEIPTLFHNKSDLALAIAGGVVAGIAAYLSVKFLTTYFENRRLNSFAIYCVIVGTLSFIFFSLRTFNILP